MLHENLRFNFRIPSKWETPPPPTQTGQETLSQAIHILSALGWNKGKNPPEGSAPTSGHENILQ